MPAVERITKGELLEHLTLLDPEARRWRFGFTISDGSLENYTNGIAGHDYILGIRESITSKRIVAAIHMSIADDGNSAEMGLSTLKDARRKGLAERLLRYTVDMLRNRGITQIYSVCLPDNLPLLSLIRKLNITSITGTEDDKQAIISIPMAGIDSIVSEITNQRMIMIDHSMKPWAALWEGMLKKNEQQIR
jgi:GNAT superfamily N-acetyltransferase